MSNDLTSKGWLSIKLGLLIKNKTGSVNPANFPNETFDLFSIPAYESYTPEILKGSQIGSAKKVVQKNDVLLSRIVPHIQRCWIVGPANGRRQIGSGEWIVFDGSTICSHYLRYFLLSYGFHMKFMRTISGVGGSLTRANPTQTAEFEIPLPPLAEQQRIVAKIEELFSELDKGIQTLKTAQQQLKEYRQAVLKYAFEGKLTNPDVKEGELPKGWCKLKLNEISRRITKGSTPTSYGYQFLKNGINFIKVENVKNGEISIKSITDYISEEAHIFQKRSQLQEGDILFSIAGTIGEICVIKTEHLPANTNQAFAVISGVSDFMNVKILALQLESFIQKIKLKSRGGAMNNISLGDLKLLDIIVPPKSDADRFLLEIESRLTVCDKIEESIEQGLQQADALRQSILKSAFEGNLVPQDPNDEPASVLLERIKAERAASKPMKKSRKLKEKA